MNNKLAEVSKNMEEIWLPVVGYEGLYEVSNLGNVKTLGMVVAHSDGRVRHCKGKLMKTSECSKRDEAEKGYLEVRLTNENKESKAHRVHRLVAEAFIENVDNKPIVNHIDGDKHNNNVDNLEWATYSENNQHAYDNNLRTDNKQVVMYDCNDNIVKIFNSLHEAGRSVGCNHRNIHLVCNGQRKTAGGFRWRYASCGVIGNNQVLFAKQNPNAIIPTKRDCDGGYDLYPCFDEDYIVILPHETKLIPTGIATAFSKDWVAIIKERGSTGSKNMTVHCGVIDSGFRNQWFVCLGNDNRYPIVISKKDTQCKQLECKQLVEEYKKEYEECFVYPYEKAIAQFIMLPVPQLNAVEIPYDQLITFTSERGMGALGSSKK